MSETGAAITAESDAGGPVEITQAPRRTTILEQWISFLLIAYIPLLLVAGALSYFSLEIAKGLKLNTNITSLMPDGVPSVDNLKNVIAKTGGYSSAMILVESPDPDAALRYLGALGEKIRGLDWATSAEYSESTAVFERNKLIYVDQDDLREMDYRLASRMDYEKKKS